MTTFVLDSSAVLRMLDKESGWQRIVEILESYADGKCAVAISAVQWGEIAGRLRKRAGIAEQYRIMQKLADLQLQVEPVLPASAVHSAELKVDHSIAYADAFALELTLRSAERVLVTADYGFKQVTDVAAIEFLPVK